MTVAEALERVTSELQMIVYALADQLARLREPEIATFGLVIAARRRGGSRPAT